MERRSRIVKVTRRGQTTIPIEFRRRHRIEKGAKLIIEDRGDAMVIRPLARLEDLAGFLSQVTTVDRLTKILAESREDEG
jgi:bifunctional DNA-binding transcriptional regulator/antitoxin component of YhaV-PrlF toxin-antitoxin module